MTIKFKYLFYIGALLTCVLAALNLFGVTAIGWPLVFLPLFIPAALWTVGAVVVLAIFALFLLFLLAVWSGLVVLCLIAGDTAELQSHKNQIKNKAKSWRN